jgi:hypothetical protein
LTILLLPVRARSAVESVGSALDAIVCSSSRPRPAFPLLEWRAVATFCVGSWQTEGRGPSRVRGGASQGQSGRLGESSGGRPRRGGWFGERKCNEQNEELPRIWIWSLSNHRHKHVKTDAIKKRTTLHFGTLRKSPYRVNQRNPFQRVDTIFHEGVALRSRGRVRSIQTSSGATCEIPRFTRPAQSTM